MHERQALMARLAVVGSLTSLCGLGACSKGQSEPNLVFDASGGTSGSGGQGGSTSGGAGSDASAGGDASGSAGTGVGGASSGDASDARDSGGSGALDADGSGSMADSGPSADSGGARPDAAADASGIADAQSGPEAGDASDQCPVVVRESDCDRTQRPIVFVHGTFGSGDNIANVALLFGSNGYCQDRFVAVDYNSLGGNPLAQLDALIGKVLADTGLDKVELMGHSQGTSHCYTYLEDPAHVAKVAHYVHLAGGAKAAPPGGVPTMSVASMGDTLLGDAGVAGAEKTVVFQTQDHFAVASSTATFVELHKYLRGRDPQYTTLQCGEETVTLSGKAESFADNAPVASGKTEIYELGSAPRDRAMPIATLTATADGSFGPWQAKRLQAYEFKGFDGQGRLIGRQYFAPFKRSDRLLRLLVPSAHLVAAGVTNSVVRDDRHVAVIARQVKGAFRKDLGDSLKINGIEVLSDPIANADTSTVGLFLFDENRNGVTNGGSLLAYAATPFVKGTDVFMSASPPAFLEMNFNGTVLKIPNWPSASEGLTSVMFP
jgi:pimeloyl-ACP methyl ester carboxylesterase